MISFISGFFSSHYVWEVDPFVPRSCSSFILMALEYSVVWIYHNLYIHSLDDGHVSCF